MNRQLDKGFIDDLIEDKGQLRGLLDYVQADNTLDLQIRGNYINIYYRGGNVLKVSKKGNSYTFRFDPKYLNQSSASQKSLILKHKDGPEWDTYFPLAKQAMDFFFSKKKKDEREFQQLVVRENNTSSVASSTDYFIIDIEYDNRSKARFDLIAVEWPSTTSHRKLSKSFRPKLVVIEMKCGDKALKNSSGMKKHCDDFNAFTSDPNQVSSFKSEMLELFRQKRRLKLIPCLTKNKNEVQEFDDEIELLLLIANHDPATSTLHAELRGLSHEKVKFITSNFMGYGLYNQNIYGFDEFSTRFKKQIYDELQNP